MVEGWQRAGDPSPFERGASWEDPGLLRALDVRPDDDVLVFEPSGDDALTLAARGARSVRAVVPDAGAAALVELKRAAARELPALSIRSFLGLGHFGRRVWFYHYLRPGLPPETRTWGDRHEGLVREGLLTQGALERGLAELRERVLPLTVGRGAVAALLAARDLDTQRAVVHAQWRGLRWRAAAAVALPRLARLAGAAPGDGHAHLQALLERVPLAHSPFAHALLTGEWREADEAGTWRAPDVLAALKPQVATLRVAVGARAAALSEPDAASVVVLGRAPLSAVEGAALLRALRPEGRVLGWGPPPAGLRVDDTIASLDRGVFPGRPWIGTRP
jgi:hypothetical protein